MWFLLKFPLCIFFEIHFMGSQKQVKSRSTRAMSSRQLNSLQDLCNSDTPLHPSEFPSFLMFISISPLPHFCYQGSFQSHLTWVQSHLACSHPCENSIFHLAWKNSRNSHEVTPFPSMRYLYESAIMDFGILSISDSGIKVGKPAPSFPQV